MEINDGLWSLYSIDWGGMSIHLRDIVEATRKPFKGNKQMEFDREKLKRVERVGPGCINKVQNARLSSELHSPE